MDATYQRLVNKVFADKIKRSMEVYMGDMLVKSLSNILMIWPARLHLFDCKYEAKSEKNTFLG